MMKKPIPVWPSVATVEPSSNCRSFIELARPVSSDLSRSLKSGTCLMSSTGAGIEADSMQAAEVVLGLDRLDALRQLLDAAVGCVQLFGADAVELLAAL